jgi:hypothetical protein
MRIKIFTLIIAFIGFGFLAAPGARASGGSAEALARSAVSEKQDEAAPAIAALRSMGPAGLQTLLEVYGEEIKRGAAGVSQDSPEWQRLTAALDTVSQQRNSYASGLYWYTDFEEAKRAAAATNKPILSLRLLGNLTEEFSCANSRFFRAVLYSNAEVSRHLRENFILHWKSVRPAPRVTIDFGDGRKLERTLTGNSVHYVLDSKGQAVDALPGLYGPSAFLRGLAQAEALVGQIKQLDSGARDVALRNYHNARIRAIADSWVIDVNKIGGRVPEDVLARIERRKKAAPGAIEVAPLAVAKSVTETSILRAITADATALEAVTKMDDWAKIAKLHAEEARLDKQSVAFILAQNKQFRNSPELLARTLQNLERYLALDTVRNEYMMRSKLHGMFATDFVAANLEAFNERVYAQLFMTPRTDPWLGLYSPDVYTALDNGGVNR